MNKNAPYQALAEAGLVNNRPHRYDRDIDENPHRIAEAMSFPMSKLGKHRDLRATTRAQITHAGI
jgi:hypothetical protein